MVFERTDFHHWYHMISILTPEVSHDQKSNIALCFDSTNVVVPFTMLSLSYDADICGNGVI